MWPPCCLIVEQSCFLLENGSAYCAMLENALPHVQPTSMSQPFQYNCFRILPSNSVGAVPHCIRGGSYCFSENFLQSQTSLGSCHSSSQILLDPSAQYLSGIPKNFRHFGISLISVVSASFPLFFCVFAYFIKNLSGPSGSQTSFLNSLCTQVLSSDFYKETPSSLIKGKSSFT